MFGTRVSGSSLRTRYRRRNLVVTTLFCETGYGEDVQPRCEWSIPTKMRKQNFSVVFSSSRIRTRNLRPPELTVGVEVVREGHPWILSIKRRDPESKERTFTSISVDGVFPYTCMVRMGTKNCPLSSLPVLTL